MAFLVSVVLVFTNIFSVVAIVGFFYPVYEKTNKYIVLIPMIFLGLVNYIFLYGGKYYERIFDDFEKSIDKYKSWNKSIMIYIIGSILIMLVILTVADLQT